MATDNTQTDAVRQELEDYFKDVKVDITVEQVNQLVNGETPPPESAPADKLDGEPPIVPPKDAKPAPLTWDQFVTLAREIILKKCPDATDKERGKYFTSVIGANLNQVWASPGDHKDVLRLLAQSTKPVRSEEPPKAADKPKAPANGSKPANSVSKVPDRALTKKNTPITGPLTVDQIRAKYTMDYTRKNNKTGEITHSDYLVVAGRVLLLRAQAETQGYQIRTTLVHMDADAGYAVMKAEIYGDTGFMLSSAHAMCNREAASFVGGRYVEKAETAAIGRALGLIGLGTEEFLDDDDENNLSDSPVEQ